MRQDTLTADTLLGRYDCPVMALRSGIDDPLSLCICSSPVSFALSPCCFPLHFVLQVFVFDMICKIGLRVVQLYDMDDKPIPGCTLLLRLSV
jgi:hypothetical protein